MCSLLPYGTGVVFSRQFGPFCAITIVHRHVSTVMWVVFSRQFGPFCASFHCGVGFQPSVLSFLCHTHCPPTCFHCDVGSFQPSVRSFLCHSHCPPTCVHCDAGYFQRSVRSFWFITIVHWHVSTEVSVVFRRHFGPFCAIVHCGVVFQPSVRSFPCHNHCLPAYVHCDIGCFQSSFRSFLCHNHYPQYHCPPACVHCGVGCFQPSFRSFPCHNQCLL